MRSSGPGSLVALAILAVGACAPAARQFPPSTEAELGDQLIDDLDDRLFLIGDSAVTAPIAELGEQLGAAAPYAIAPYSFKVVDGEVVSAFAVAGGAIYVYRGLIEESRSMGEIAAVLGHEIAHLTSGHASHKLYEYQRDQLGLGPPLDRSRLLFFASYSRSLEAEADSIAVGIMMAAGWDPDGLIGFLETLLELRDDEPGKLESPFLTHPMIEERIENVERIVDRLPPEELSGLRRSSDAYVALEAELAELPPAPRSEFR